jgi:putative oxidoreductase
MTSHAKQARTWNIILWLAQGTLAVMFLGVGLMKAGTPIDELSKIIPLAGEMPVLIRAIGLIEILGGLGLLLPAGLRIKPQLTILAAIGIAAIMILAMFVHIFRGETSAIGTNIVLGLLAVFIAWGRSGKAPIAARK